MIDVYPTKTGVVKLMSYLYDWPFQEVIDVTTYMQMCLFLVCSCRTVFEVCTDWLRKSIEYRYTLFDGNLLRYIRMCSGNHVCFEFSWLKTCLCNNGVCLFLKASLCNNAYLVLTYYCFHDLRGEMLLQFYRIFGGNKLK
jgi:hypothetical protein